MRVIALLLLAACGSKNESPPPVEDLSCPAVVAHVAKLTLNEFNYAAGRSLRDGTIVDSDPRAFRQRRIDSAVEAACGKDQARDDYFDCTKKVVLGIMAAECVDREWSDERKRCLLAAKDDLAIDACGPAPAPTLEIAPTP